MGAAGKHPADPDLLAITPGGELNENGKKACQEQGPGLRRILVLLGFIAEVHLKKPRPAIRRHSCPWDFRRLFSWGKSICACPQDAKSRPKIRILL